jgi:hypothetical protein
MSVTIGDDNQLPIENYDASIVTSLAALVVVFFRSGFWAERQIHQAAAQRVMLPKTVMDA